MGSTGTESSEHVSADDFDKETERAIDCFKDIMNFDIEENGETDCVLCQSSGKFLILPRNEMTIRMHLSNSHFSAYRPLCCKLCGHKYADQNLVSQCCMRARGKETQSIDEAKFSDNLQNVIDELVQVFMDSSLTSEQLHSRYTVLTEKVRAIDFGPLITADTSVKFRSSEDLYRTWENDLDDLLLEGEKVAEKPLMKCDTCSENFATISAANDHYENGCSGKLLSTVIPKKLKKICTESPAVQEKGEIFRLAGLNDGAVARNFLSSFGAPMHLANLWVKDD